AEYRIRFPGRDTDDLADEDLLREVMNTVGKAGKLGEHVKCVVSVSMLTEGWDANTVTHVLGVRAFGTQLLCEQVVGRALRRMSYAANEAGHFDPEYAEVYGVHLRLESRVRIESRFQRPFGVEQQINIVRRRLRLVAEEPDRPGRIERFESFEFASRFHLGGILPSAATLSTMARGCLPDTRPAAWLRRGRERSISNGRHTARSGWWGGVFGVTRAAGCGCPA